MKIGELGPAFHEVLVLGDQSSTGDNRTQPMEQIDSLPEALVDGRFLLQLAEPFVDRLQVCDGQFGLDGLDVTLRIQVGVDMNDIRCIEGPDNVTYGVDVTDVGQELIAEAFTMAWLPSPDPRLSTNVTVAGVTLGDPNNSASGSRRGSGMGTIPVLGSMVANG